MKYLLIVFIIILGFLLIKCLPIESFSVVSNDYIHPHAIINKSTINGGGRGIFATKDYKEGEIIEICPCIKTETALIEGKCRDYLFGFDDETSLIGFGYCSIYNHSDDYNARWEVIDEYKIKIIAEKNIIAGEEIFVSYGDLYWEGRSHYLKKN